MRNWRNTFIVAILLLWAVSAQAAITLVVSGKQGSTNGFTTSGFDSTGANFGVVSIGSVSAARGITDNKGNTWTALTASLSPVFSRSSQLYYAYNITAGSGHTLTTTGTNEFIGLSWAFFSGVLSASDPLGGTQGSGGTASGTSFSVSSVTPSEDNCVVVTSLMNDSSAGMSIDSSFVLHQALQGVGGTYLGSSIASIIQTTAGATGPTWSWTTANNASGASAWFKASGGGGGPTCTPTLTLLGVGRCGDN